MAFQPVRSPRRPYDPYSSTEQRKRMRTDEQMAKRIYQKNRRMDAGGQGGPSISAGVSVGSVSPSSGLTPEEDASNSALMARMGDAADRRESNRTQQTMAKVQARQVNPAMGDGIPPSSPYGVASSRSMSPGDEMARKKKGDRGSINGTAVATMFPRRRLQSDPYVAVR